MAAISKIGKHKRSTCLDPRRGYDLISSAYEKWHWSEFWRRNEAPIVGEWIDGATPGLMLDLGSGTGAYRFDMKAMGHRCIAIDLSISMLRVQQAKDGTHPQQNVGELIQGDIRALPFGASTFDYLLCMRVLGHIRSLTLAFIEMARVAKKGAYCTLSDVHPEHPYTQMSLCAERERVVIRTYKHSIDSLKSAIAAAGQLELLDLREYCLRDLLWNPPKEQFQKIYREPERRIFYLCRLQRV